MRKLIFIFLIVIVTANLILLAIALTNPESYFYPYRLIIGISMLTFGGFLRQQFVSKKKPKKNKVAYLLKNTILLQA